MATRKVQQRQSYGGALLALETDPRLVAMPTGGTTGQVLAKSSGTDYDTGWITASSGGGGLTPTASKTANYTAASGQLVLCNANGGAFTVTLPASPSAGVTVGAKKTDVSGNAITVVGSGGTTIDGDATCVITSPEAAATFVFDGTNWQIQNTAIVSAGTDSLQTLWTPAYTNGNWHDRRTPTGSNITLTSVSSGTAGSAPIAISSVSYVPMFAHRALVIDTVAIITGSSTPTGGATIRIGLYTNSATNAPGTRIYDFGTVSPTANSTVYTLAASGTIPKGWSWWALSCNSTNSSSIYTVANTATIAPQSGLSSLTQASAVATQTSYMFYEAGTGAALVATATPLSMTFTTGLVASANVWYRVVG